MDGQSISDRPGTTKGRVKFATADGGLKMSDQMDSESNPSRLDSSLVGDKKRIAHQNKSQGMGKGYDTADFTGNGKNQKNQDRRRADSDLMGLDNYNYKNLDKNNQLTQISEKVMVPGKKESGSESNPLKRYDKRKTNSMRDSKYFNSLNQDNDDLIIQDKISGKIGLQNETNS